MIRHFGAALYDSVRRWPARLIYRAAEIERERDAERRLLALQDQALATGLKLGQRYVDPANPSGARRGSEPYYSLQPLLDAQGRLERAARPWEYEPEVVRARRELAEDADFDAMWSAIGALHA